MKVFEGGAKYVLGSIVNFWEVSKNFLLVSHGKNPSISSKVISEQNVIAKARDK